MESWPFFNYQRVAVELPFSFSRYFQIGSSPSMGGQNRILSPCRRVRDAWKAETDVPLAFPTRLGRRYEFFEHRTSSRI